MEKDRASQSRPRGFFFSMHRLIIPAVTAALVATPLDAQQPALELKKGDRISIIGSNLADWLQHEGSLEAMLHQAYPNHDLQVRNLGIAGDALTQRNRSDNFGSPEEWLTRLKTNVVFAFFGTNESFAGPGGLEKFKTDLDQFLKKTQAADYAGSGRPQVLDTLDPFPEVRERG